MIITLRSADSGDVTAAAALLYRAVLASPTDRLLGSATTGCATINRRIPFADLLTAGLCFGRVDLALSGGRIDGVACWIDHPDGPVPPRVKARRTGLDDLLDRLYTIDLVVRSPAARRHQHLACLGTRPGYDARMIADLLLHRQCLLEDRDGGTFFTEVHEETFGTWLLQRSNGYHNHGVSLGTESDPVSHLLSYTGTPPNARTRYLRTRRR